MPAMGPGRVKTSWRKHGRVTTFERCHARPFCRVRRLFPSGSAPYADSHRLGDPVFQAFREQRALPTIHPLNEALHPILSQIPRESYRRNQIMRDVFTRPGSLGLAGCGEDSARIVLQVNGTWKSASVMSKRKRRPAGVRRSREGLPREPQTFSSIGE